MKTFNAADIDALVCHALLKGGEAWYGKAGAITPPVLIIHGTEDPVLPFAHAQALEATLPHATLLALKGSGHEIHRLEWERIIQAIIAHTT